MGVVNLALGVAGRILAHVAFVVLLFAAVMFSASCRQRERAVALRSDGAPSDAPSDALLPGFGPPRLIAELLDPTDAIQDPTLSNDELELYFSTEKSGTYDIWRSTRSAVGQPWSPATRVDELSSASGDLEPELAADGLTIYLSSDRPGAVPSFRIWTSRRSTPSAPWGVPQIVMFGPLGIDRGPTIDRPNLTLVFASSDGAPFDLYVVNRVAVTAPWGAAIPLGEVNSASEDWDPALFRGNLAMMFGSRREGDPFTTDLFETMRPIASSPFLSAEPVVELNSPLSEGDPWLSNDGRHIVFSSDRTGLSRLYEAWR